MELFSQIYEDVLTKFFEIYENHKNNEDRDVIQSASFGFGVIASRLPPEQYAPYAERIFGVLEEVINVPDNMSEDNSYATENAISSLLKLVYYQRDGTIVTDQHTKKYLGYLPLKEDLDEALAVNKSLIEQVEKKNPNLFGQDNINAPDIEQALNRIAKMHAEDPELKTLEDDLVTRLNAILS